MAVVMSGTSPLPIAFESSRCQSQRPAWVLYVMRGMLSSPLPTFFFVAWLDDGEGRGPPRPVDAGLDGAGQADVVEDEHEVEVEVGDGTVDREGCRAEAEAPVAVAVVGGGAGAPACVKEVRGGTGG